MRQEKKATACYVWKHVLQKDAQYGSFRWNLQWGA